MTDDTHAPGETAETHEIRLEDGSGTVVVRKLVSKGERLEIDAGEDRVTLDALLLEALTWQRDQAAIDELLDADTAIARDPVATATTGGDDERGETEPDRTDPGTVTISNEYSHALVREVSTPAGPGLAVTTPGRGTSIRLGVQSLRDLAAVEDTYVFSVWFRTPFGPEDTPVEGPL